ncbi:MAG: ABC transporter permease [Planctomycetota bacterium]
MLTLIARRLIQLPIILALVFSATFTLAWVLPGDPFRGADERQVDPAIEAAMRAQYNLDSPWSFLRSYTKELFTEADLGPSLKYRDRKVADILGEALPVSATLGAAAIGVALLIGTVAGVVGALKPGTALEAGSLGVALIGVSLPSFVTGTLLLAFAGVLATHAPAFALPIGGWTGPSAVLLPAIALGLTPAAYIARLLRLGLADLMHSDFVRTARAKGVSPNRALFGHALKVAYLPVLSFLGPAAASAMTGSFVIEQVFNIPGLGEHFVNAVLNKDQTLLLGIVLTYSTILVLFNLVVDVAYGWLDPRIELG